MSESSDCPADFNYECTTDYDDSEMDFDDKYRYEEDDCQSYPLLPEAQYDSSGQGRHDQFPDSNQSLIAPGGDLFSTLPGEMLGEIARIMYIWDINALSQTSKTLYGRLSQLLYRRGLAVRFRVRSVWLLSLIPRTRTLLHYSVGSGRIPLERLLAADRNDAGDQSRALLRSINSPDSDYIRPLHSAALVGDSRSVALLIRHGAKVNARTFGGHTPLHYAAAQGNPQVAILLLNAGANRNPRCERFNHTPLDVAMIHCKDSEASVVATLRLDGCEGMDELASKSRESQDSEIRLIWEERRRKEVFELGAVTGQMVHIYTYHSWIPTSSAGAWEGGL